jgi:hypothetical protein
MRTLEKKYETLKCGLIRDVIRANKITTCIDLALLLNGIDMRLLVDIIYRIYMLGRTYIFKRLVICKMMTTIDLRHPSS